MYDAEFVALGVGQDCPRLGARLPDIDPGCAERKTALNLGVTVPGAAGEVTVEERPDGDRRVWYSRTDSRLWKIIQAAAEALDLD